MIALGDVVKRAESGNNPHHMRFEVFVYDRINRRVPRLGVLHQVQEINRCNANTAAMIGATCWGAWGLTGLSIYGSGKYERPIGEFLGSMAAQNMVAGYFLHEIGYSADQDWTRIDPENFAAMYRAGSTTIADAYLRTLRSAAHEISQCAIPALV